MQCLHPITIKNPHWGTSKQTIDDTMYIQVPCGRCIACQNNRRSSWVLRNRFENLHCISSLFVTLTYSDDKLPLSPCGIPTLNYEDVKKFMKRLRKLYSGVKLRYFLCGEYGSKTFRPHYHSIIYDLPLLTNGKDFIEYYRKKISDVWKNGNVSASSVNDNRIGYITKYIIKSNEDREKFEQCGIKPPRLLVSHGLGKGLQQHLDYSNGVLRFFGTTSAVPRYIIEKNRESSPDIQRDFDERRKEYIIRRREALLRLRERDKKESPYKNTRSEFIAEQRRAASLLKRCKTQKDF